MRAAWALLALLLGTGHAQLWATPQDTAAQGLLKGYTAQGNVLSRGGARVTLDVVAGHVVGVLVEASSTADVARGIAAAWGSPEANVTKLQASLSSPQVLAAARKGLIQFSDDSGTDVIALKAAGDGAALRWTAYVAVKIWPDSAFPATQNVGGQVNAPSVLRIFSDFQCPYCKQMWDASMQTWETNPAQFRTFHYQFPLTQIHPNAFAAAEASECASAQGKFWPFADALFAQYSSWIKVRTADVPAQFSAYAKTTGLNVPAFTTCLSQHTFKASVEAQQKAGMAVMVQGTPTVYLNGVKLSDYSDETELATVRAVTTATPSASSLIDGRLKQFR